MLGALAQTVARGRVDVAGCVDQTQVGGVVYQWRQSGKASWKLPLLERIAAGAFTGKLSTPYGAGSVHDFMHAKVTVADDTVFVGSFNLSRSGEKNAENVLEIADAQLAERLARYVDEVRARYPPLLSTPVVRSKKRVRSDAGRASPGGRPERTGQGGVILEP